MKYNIYVYATYMIIWVTCKCFYGTGRNEHLSTEVTYYLIDSHNTESTTKRSDSIVLLLLMKMFCTDLSLGIHVYGIKQVNRMRKDKPIHLLRLVSLCIVVIIHFIGKVRILRVRIIQNVLQGCYGILLHA